MKALTLLQTILTVAIGLSVAACQHSDPVRTENTGATTAAGKSPLAMLAGRWHNNEDGATKMFTPKRGTQLTGRADGFWPDGGTYEVTEENLGKRSLHLSVRPLNPEADDHFQVREGRVTFTADGKHMTWTRKMPNRLPDQETTYYRVP